jgi:hypothetical protein
VGISSSSPLCRDSGDIYEQATVKTVAGEFQGRHTYFGGFSEAGGWQRSLKEGGGVPGTLARRRLESGKLRRCLTAEDAGVHRGKPNRCAQHTRRKTIFLIE